MVAAVLGNLHSVVGQNSIYTSEISSRECYVPWFLGKPILITSCKGRCQHLSYEQRRPHAVWHDVYSGMPAYVLIGCDRHRLLEQWQ